MINIDALNDDEKLAALESIHKSIAESKEIQKKKITTNVELIVKALKKIESDLKQRYDETGQLIANLKNGEDGRDGKDGKDGKNGRDGRDGPMGPRGYDGLPGRNGIDGADGVSITDAHIDFDGSLIISLSSGRVINVGEVVAADIAEKIKVITNGGGTSQGVLDAIASLQAQIDSIASGLVYQGTWNASTNNPALASGVGTAGYYYIVAVAGSTNLNGVTDWQVGDWALFNGTVWQKLDQTNLVTSVAGRTGAVTLTTADIGGLGTIATQAANNVSITGGSITGITDLAIADGGTGASTAAAAITALTGTQTAGRYLRSDGTNAALAAIVAADVPTLNQNTTGTAAGLSATLATTSGGTGLTSFTANGVVYASSTSALATGSALTFDGSSLGMGNPTVYGTRSLNSYTGTTASAIGFSQQISGFANTFLGSNNSGSSVLGMATGTFGQSTSNSIPWTVSAYGSEQMRLTSTGLGIGTSSPSAKVHSSLSSSGATSETLRLDNPSDSANAGTKLVYRISGWSFDGGFASLTRDGSSGGTIMAFGTSANASTTNASEKLRIDSAGNVGIGTSSPSAKLNVFAGGVVARFGAFGTTTYDDFQIESYAGSTGIGCRGSSNLYFAMNGTTRMYLTSSGNLGIGTSSPAYKLDVATGAIQVKTGASVSSAIYDWLIGYSGTEGYGVKISTIQGSTSTRHGMAFYTSAAALPAERMRIDENGNVGIGTSSPANKLDVRTGTTGNIAAFFGTSTYHLAIEEVGGVMFLDANNGSATIGFKTNDTERMRITSAGNVGIGTSSPGAMLDLAANNTAGTALNVLRFTDTDGSATAPQEIGKIEFYSSDASTPGAGVKASIVGIAEVGNPGGALTFNTDLLTGAPIERMRIDRFGNVGIGTSSPAFPLDVQSTGTGSTIASRIYRSDGTIALLRIGNSTSGSASSAPAFGSDTTAAVIYTDNSERMRLNSSGNLLLGTTATRTSGGITPAFQVEGITVNAGSQYLTVNNATAANSAIFQFNRSRGTANGDVTAVASGDTLGRLFFAGADGTGLIFAASISAQVDGTPGTNDMPGRLVFSTTADGASSPTERMRIDSSGNVGIGVTTPGTTRLVIRGDATTNFAVAKWSHSSNASSGFDIGYASSVASNDVSIWNYENGFIRFATNNSERARIDSSGNLLVGTTSQLYSAAGSRLNVDAGANGGATIKTSGGSAQASVYCFNSATTGDNAFVSFGTESTWTGRGTITYNRAGGLVAYNTTSDYRAKDISGPVTNSGSLIDATPVYMGTMKGATQERPMFIAHETPAYAHTGEKDAVDADGNPVYQQMDASALIPVMWAEIQSLRKRLADAGI